MNWPAEIGLKNGPGSMRGADISFCVTAYANGWADHRIERAFDDYLAPDSLLRNVLPNGVMGWSVAFHSDLWQDEGYFSDSTCLRYRHRQDSVPSGWPEQGRPHRCQEAIFPFPFKNTQR